MKMILEVLTNGMSSVIHWKLSWYLNEWLFFLQSWMLSRTKREWHTPYKLRGFLTGCRINRAFGMGLPRRLWNIWKGLYNFEAITHLGILELIIIIISFTENFSMNTANHANTPCILTHVTYRKSSCRKKVALPCVLSDVESSARATGWTVGTT